MRRIIVHLIRGEARSAHETITKELAEKFDSFPIHERIPPHLTLKRWFELTDERMTELYKLLDSFVASQKQSEYTLGGFSNFGDGVIYLDVKPSSEMLMTAQSLLSKLHEIEELTFDEHDNEEMVFHATVAMRALRPFDFKKLWDYLHEKEYPVFQMKFNNIAFMKKESDVWETERVWELRS